MLQCIIYVFIYFLQVMYVWSWHFFHILADKRKNLRALCMCWWRLRHSWWWLGWFHPDCDFGWKSPNKTHKGKQIRGDRQKKIMKGNFWMYRFWEGWDKVHSFCKSTLLCRLPIRPVNMIRIDSHHTQPLRKTHNLQIRVIANHHKVITQSNIVLTQTHYSNTRTY